MLNLPIGSANDDDGGDCSTCYCIHPDFIKFLCQVTTFEMSLCYIENGDGCEYNNADSLAQFTADLGRIFIHHLSTVEALIVEANESCAIGLHPGCFNLGMFPISAVLASACSGTL